MLTSMINHDAAYNQFELLIAEQFKANDDTFYTTDAKPEWLWDIYLSSLPEENRQHYNCQCCKRFIENYGGLVQITVNNNKVSIWDAALTPEYFGKAVRYLEHTVERSKITGVFLSDTAVLGVPQSVKNGWTHLHGSVKPYKNALMTAEQRMADIKEEHGMLCRGLAEYKYDVASEALRVLESDTLYRAEKAIEMARWFVDLHRKIIAEKQKRNEIIWKTVANAPAGYCHVKSLMIHTLMDDLLAGMDFEQVSKRWAAKMHPDQYARPQVAPTAGAIDNAEKIVEKLGIAKSLERRYATLDDIEVKLWVPTLDVNVEGAKTGRFFDSLRQPTPGIVKLELPATDITWEKFKRTVMPTAKRIEIMVPRHGSFYGLTAAVHADAPIIYQWANAVSHFFKKGGSYAAEWSLSQGWADVACIFEKPSGWIAGTFSNDADIAYFVIAQAKHINTCNSGIFPENLKAELHSIRSVIEAYSNTHPLVGGEAGNANGLAMSKREGSVTVRVNGSVSHRIDRWD